MDLVLFFIIRKMLYKISKLLLKSGSRLHTFSYKTCFNRLYSLNNGDLTYSIRKLALISQISWSFLHFWVSFMSMIYFIVKKLKYRIFGLISIAKIHFWFYSTVSIFTFKFLLLSVAGSIKSSISFEICV